MNTNGIGIQIGNWSKDYVLAVTDAPKEYDGFGTFTVQEFTYPIDCGKVFTKGPARIVAIQREHLDWHQNRYSSGLHVFWAGPEIAEEFPDIVKAATETLVKRLLQVAD